MNPEHNPGMLVEKQDYTMNVMPFQCRVQYMHFPIAMFLKDVGKAENLKELCGNAKDRNDRNLSSG